MSISFKKELEINAVGKNGTYTKKVRANFPYQISKIHYNGLTVDIIFVNGVVANGIALRYVLEVDKD